jgi:hypothetical protein
MPTLDNAKAAWLERVLGWRPQAGPAPSNNAGDAMAGWTAARTTALASLKALEGAYRGMKHELSDSAIILLRAIQANLTATPATPAQVKELEAYLTGDRIITEAETPNGFGFKVELRKPLLAALAKLKQEQAAGSARP